MNITNLRIIPTAKTGPQLVDPSPRVRVYIDPTKCIACCDHKENHKKFAYVLLKAGGNRGTYTESVESFFQVQLVPCQRNYASFICRRCKNLIEKYDTFCRRARELKHFIWEHCQHFMQDEQLRRPYDKTEIQSGGVKRSHPTDEETTSSSTKGKQPKKKIKLEYEGSTIPAPVKGCCHVVLSYRSLKLQNSLHNDVVKPLSNGSPYKALKALSKRYRTAFRSAACDVLKKECAKFNKPQHTRLLRASSVEDIKDVDLNKLGEVIRDCSPLLWRCLCVAAESQHRTFCVAKVTTAALTVLYSRSHNLKALQVMNGITFKSMKVTKRGFKFLSKLGITASYEGMKAFLHLDRDSVERVSGSWREHVKQAERGSLAREDKGDLEPSLEPVGGVGHPDRLEPGQEGVASVDHPYSLGQGLTPLHQVGDLEGDHPSPVHQVGDVDNHQLHHGAEEMMANLQSTVDNSSGELVVSEAGQQSAALNEVQQETRGHEVTASLQAYRYVGSDTSSRAADQVFLLVVGDPSADDVTASNYVITTATSTADNLGVVCKTEVEDLEEESQDSNHSLEEWQSNRPAVIRTYAKRCTSGRLEPPPPELEAAQLQTDEEWFQHVTEHR